MRLWIRFLFFCGVRNNKISRGFFGRLFRVSFQQNTNDCHPEICSGSPGGCFQKYLAWCFCNKFSGINVIAETLRLGKLQRNCKEILKRIQHDNLFLFVENLKLYNRRDYLSRRSLSVGGNGVNQND